MKKIFLVLLSFLLFTGVAYASGNFWPWNLRLGSPWALDLANVEYTGINRAIHASMQYGAELEFDGVGTYVDTAAVLSDGDDYTLCVTAKKNTDGSYYGLLTGKYGKNGPLFHANKTISVPIDAVTDKSLASGLVPANTDYRVVVSVTSGGTCYLYVDGNQVDFTDLGAGNTTEALTGTIFRLGAYTPTANYYLDGTIANAQIWNHAFTQADVTYDYANQSTTADTRTGTDLVRANLVGHWKLDEQWGTVAEDSSDGGHDGTLVGFGDREYPRLRDIGKKPDDSAVVYSGQMLDFDGSDDNVDCGSPQEMATSDTLTIAVTFVTTDAGRMTLIGQDYKTFEVSIDDDVGSSRILFLWGDGTNYTNANVYPAFDLADGGVHRLVAVMYKSIGNVVAYIDGAYIGSDTGLGYACLSSAGLLEIGQRNGGAQPFDGFIGNVQIWNAALTPDDVAFDYANPELPAYNRPGTSLTAANLKGWWPLIEGSGDTAYDWSGNGNHGTLEGFTHPDCWDAAAALSDPRVFQTAYADWGMGSNVIEYSDIFETDWSVQRGSFASGGTRLDGRDAILVSEDSSTGQHRLRAGATINNLTAGTNTIRCRVKKAGTKDTLAVALYNGADGYTARASLVFSTGVLTISEGSGAVSELGSGWFEVELSGTSTAVTDFVFIGEITSVEGINGAYFYIDGVQAVNGDTIGATTITHATPATNALTPIRSWETANQFTSALNWNGRSYADCGNGVDVNPSTALIVEMVTAYNNYTLTSPFYLVNKLNQYKILINAGGNALYLRIFQSGGTSSEGYNIGDGVPHHVIYSFDGTTLTTHIDGVPKIERISSYSGESFANNANILRICQNNTRFQLPLFRMITDASAQKIIDKDLDAWVAKRYAKACKKYDL